ncbi:Ligand of Numb protein X 2 [Leucoagaricus sp. SymC.cos]|nr:Ligand of Numb protein X 2 [Leucoagaricus sp. SymC.cos]
MSLYTYVNTPNSNLVCCICQTPFTEPTTTLTCAHTFCRECILRALQHTALCPVDRSPLGEGDLGPANPIIRSLVEELEVECVHSNTGCKWTGQRQWLAAHLRDKCPFGQVECEEEGCGMVITRNELRTHRVEVHGLVEPEDKMEQEREMEKHDAASANPVSYNGSEKRTNGLSDTSIQPTDQQQQQQKTIELLIEQNMLLRHRVEVLEGAMQMMKKEMGTVRNAIGPWIRTRSTSTSSAATHTINSAASSGGGMVSTMLSSGPAGGISPGRNLTHGMQGHISHGRGASLSLPGGEASASAVSMNSGGNGSGGDPLAGYFPTLGEFGIMPQYGTSAGHHYHHPGLGGNSAFMHQQPGGIIGGGGMPGGLQMNPQAVTRVAPLDLGTNLVGTLEGLRESVIGVAAGVDSLGRRSEIALANETLRLGEEVISLRAGVHGLRMQIHAMMMERNTQVTGARGEESTGPGGSWMAGGGLGLANGPPPRMYAYGPPNITKL